VTRTVEELSCAAGRAYGPGARDHSDVAKDESLTGLTNNVRLGLEPSSAVLDPGAVGDVDVLDNDVLHLILHLIGQDVALNIRSPSSGTNGKSQSVGTSTHHVPGGYVDDAGDKNEPVSGRQLSGRLWYRTRHWLSLVLGEQRRASVSLRLRTELYDIFPF
jgi:hypothetical protein